MAEVITCRKSFAKLRFEPWTAESSIMMFRSARHINDHFDISANFIRQQPRSTPSKKQRETVSPAQCRHASPGCIVSLSWTTATTVSCSSSRARWRLTTLPSAANRFLRPSFSLLSETREHENSEVQCCTLSPVVVLTENILLGLDKSELSEILYTAGILQTVDNFRLGRFAVVNLFSFASYIIFDIVLQRIVLAACAKRLVCCVL